MSASAAKAVLAPSLTRVSQKSWLTGLCLASADALAVLLAVAFTSFVFHVYGAPWSDLLKQLAPGLCTLFVFAMLGLYPVIGLNPALEFQRVILGSIGGCAFAAALTFLRQGAPPTIQPLTLIRYATATAATVVLVFACRFLCRSLCCQRSWWGTPAVLFGSGPEARAVFRALRCDRTGLKVVAAFDSKPILWPELDHRQVHVGTPEHAASFAVQWGVSHAIIAMPELTGADFSKVVKKHASSFRHVLVLPGLRGISSVWVEPRAIGGMLGLHLTQNLLHRRPQLVKRAFVLLLAPLAALPLLPAFAVICLAVRLTSRGPLFFGHTRIGREHRTFTAWKFRTMHQGADLILSACLESDPDLRRQWAHCQKLKKDPRVTSAGRILRKTSLDEIPQLWNVLAGHMSFVGPRPIVAAEIARYGDRFESYASVRPGITGLWQVSGRNNTTYEERVHLDEYYVANWSMWLDLYILGRTFKTVLFGEGAY